MKRIILILFFSFSLFLLTFCNKNTTNIKPKAVESFEITDVKLLNGPFKHATELNKKSLLSYNLDRLLSKFRKEAGLKPKAKSYGEWEAETIAGHSLGHHLSGCALMFQTTNDSVFLDRVKYIVNELAECQAANKNGYVGAIPNGQKIFENEIAKGNIRSQGFDLNGLWAPFYTHHKLMAGLRDSYHLCGIDEALEVEKKFADWVETIVINLNDQQLQKMLHCEHGGMNETLADLYADTKEKKYLDLTEKFYHKAVLDSLVAAKDILPNIHGNTQIPKLIGLARRYELTGNTDDKKAAQFFWERVVNHHSYVTGGHGNHEYFGQPDQLRNRLSNETTETCNVYNMLKLSRHLFEWAPNAEIADYYERALFNHILSSQHPHDGRVIYNLSLEMGGYKEYQDPEWFTCCVGTGMETHSKYAKNIFYKNDDQFIVSQLISAEVNWKDKDVTIKQTTSFPKEQGTTIEIIKAENKDFTLFVRYPYWATRGIIISLNGENIKTNEAPGSFISIKRIWNSGDIIKVEIPFTLRLETMPDDTNRVAVMFGPLVLAGDLGPENDPNASDANYVPALITEERDPSKWLIPVQETANTFRINSTITNSRNFELKPFYETHERRYSVYWDLFNQKSWEQHQQEYQAELKRKKDLELKTFDFFQPGEMQQERNHKFTGEKIRVMDYNHKKARVADRGGWFSFEMKVKHDKPMALVVDYWGGFTGSKTFDIIVNNSKIATENISGKKDGQFIDIEYQIPKGLTKGKNKINVMFKPHEGNRGGPIFGVRTIIL